LEIIGKLIHSWRLAMRRLAATKGSKIVLWGGFPARQGYGALPTLPFATQVEDYD
jgi:hypothetical protein